MWGVRRKVLDVTKHIQGPGWASHFDLAPTHFHLFDLNITKTAKHQEDSLVEIDDDLEPAVKDVIILLSVKRIQQIQALTVSLLLSFSIGKE